MAFDVEAAKADGYTDEEIQQYLATKDQPLPPEQPRDRYEEKMGTFTSAIPDVVKYGLEGAGLYGIGKAVGNAIGGAKTPPATPTPPTTFTGGANPAFDQALSKPYTAPQPPSSGNYMQRMTQLADRYLPVAGKVAKGAGLVGAGLALGQGLFGTSPEEIAILKAAEERKRQQQSMVNQIPR